MLRATLLIVAAMTTSLVSNHSVGATWADYDQTPSFGTSDHVIYTPENPLTGTMGTVAVEFSGEVYNASCISDYQINDYCPLWAQNFVAGQGGYDEGTYVSNLSGNLDHVALTGSKGVVRFTYKFSEPVEDVVLAVWSLGNPTGTEGRWKFSQPWVLIDQTTACTASTLDTRVAANGAAATNCLARVESTNSLSGSEGDGLILFPGSNSEISWEVTSPEVWAGFNIGIAETSYAANNDIVYITAGDGASVEGAQARIQPIKYLVEGLSDEDTVSVAPSCDAYTDLGFGTTLSTATPAGAYVTHCAGAVITDNAPSNNYTVLYNDGVYHVWGDDNGDGVPDTSDQRFVDWATDSLSLTSGTGPGTISATVSKGNTQGLLSDNLLNGAGVLGADANFPQTWWSPIPTIGSTKVSVGNVNGGAVSELGASIDITVAFEEAISTPRFHFLNLDNNEVTFLGDAGANATLMSGNDEFSFTDGLVNFDDEGTAASGGCEANDGTNPNGACGTIELTGSYTSVSFRVSPARSSGGDGWAWTVSTPQWQVTPSSDANSSLSIETAFYANHGKSVELTLTATQGYSATVGGTCGGSLVGTTYTTDPITAGCTVVASSTAVDSDADGVIDLEDNCPNNPNEGQGDLDDDGLGDQCDNDLDGDGVPNTEDQFGGDPSSPLLQLEGNNPGNCTIDIPATKLNLVGIDAETAPATPINNKLTFALDCDVGATATVRAFFGEPLPPNPAAYKLVEGVWTPIPGAVFDTTNQSVVYQITDGESLDLNGAVDGRIEDPVTVVSLPAAQSAQPIPLPLWLLGLTGCGLALVGFRQLRPRI